jgi:hypothetical protein
VALVEVQN